MTETSRPSPIVAGLFCKCPACGRGPLFSGYLTVAPGCSACGRSFAEAAADDGPAAFVILIVGFLVIFPALAVEIAYAPPVWVHLAIWIPVAISATLVLLRVFKSLLIALQFHHDAGEGRSDRGL
ncbi:MAG: DUF983 domain-containing protein [Sphingomonadales bacterium]|nr:DUF983 domain-containing protein [Sphingomonadales bacterium]